MKISKITKVLPLALALSLSIGCANAATLQSGTATAALGDPSETANVQYQLNLSDYVKITEHSTSGTVNAKYTQDYENLNLTGNFTAMFKVITNKPRNVVLTAPCINDAGIPSLYGLTGDHSFNLVFVNTNATDFDTKSVTAITGGSTKPDDNPDAFAVNFKATDVSTVHNNGDSADKTETITSSEADHVITFAIPNGVSTLNFQSTDVIQTTFNTRDTKGLYKAQLILTDGATTNP